LRSMGEKVQPGLYLKKVDSLGGGAKVTMGGIEKESRGRGRFQTSREKKKG